MTDETKYRPLIPGEFARLRSPDSQGDYPALAWLIGVCIERFVYDPEHQERRRLARDLPCGRDDGREEMDAECWTKLLSVDPVPVLASDSVEAYLRTTFERHLVAWLSEDSVMPIPRSTIHDYQEKHQSKELPTDLFPKAITGTLDRTDDALDDFASPEEIADGESRFRDRDPYTIDRSHDLHDEILGCCRRNTIDSKIVTLGADGYTVAEIAKQLQTTTSKIYRRRAELFARLKESQANDEPCERLQPSPPTGKRFVGMCEAVREVDDAIDHRLRKAEREFPKQHTPHWKKLDCPWTGKKFAEVPPPWIAAAFVCPARPESLSPPVLPLPLPTEFDDAIRQTYEVAAGIIRHDYGSLYFCRPGMIAALLCILRGDRQRLVADLLRLPNARLVRDDHEAIVIFPPCEFAKAAKLLSPEMRRNCAA